MMTSSNGNIFRVTGPLCGEFTGPGEVPTQRPVTRSFDVFFDLRLNKRLSKEPWGWWFETPSWSLWRQCNEWPKHASLNKVKLLFLAPLYHLQCWFIKKIKPHIPNLKIVFNRISLVWIYNKQLRPSLVLTQVSWQVIYTIDSLKM